MSSTESGLKKNYLNINMIAKIAVMGALAGALMFLNFRCLFCRLSTRLISQR